MGQRKRFYSQSRRRERAAAGNFAMHVIATN
jgi:hypothetical protein